MKYNQLSIGEINEVIVDLCEEYGSFISDECKDEVMDKFFDKFVNVTLSGMTKTEAYDFVEILGFLFDKQMTKQLEEE